MSSREFAEWVAYFGVEPWGEARADLRAAIVAATVANASPNGASRPLDPADFLPRFDPVPAQRPADHLVMVELLNAALGGLDERVGTAGK